MAPQPYQQQPPMGYPVAGAPMGYPGAGAPMGYQGGAPVGSTVIVMNQQPNYVGFGRSPTQCTCPNCRANVMTNVMISPGPTAWCACILLAFLFWPCACLPCEFYFIFAHTHTKNTLIPLYFFSHTLFSTFLPFSPSTQFALMIARTLHTAVHHVGS